MKKDSYDGYRTYRMENGVEINVPINHIEDSEMEQQQSYQNFINVLSNIVTKYATEDKAEKE